MKYLNETIGFVGAGNMATALISGLINSDQNASKIIASSPEQEHLEKLSKEVEIVSSFLIPTSFDRLITLGKSLKSGS